MPFPVRLLGEGEEIVAEFRPHWSFLGWPLVCALAAAGLTTGIVAAFPSVPIEVLYGLAAVLGAGVLWFAARCLRRVTTDLVVTTTRVVRSKGVLSRRNLEIRLERINELSYHQSIGGRLLRSGEVLIEVSGETGMVVIDHVPRPAVVQSIISVQVSDWHRSMWAPSFHTHVPESDTPPAGVPLRGTVGTEGSSAAERLVQLDELRRRGIVSAEEYAVKKQELLREL
jgi:hypothetical protein